MRKISEETVQAQKRKIVTRGGAATADGPLRFLNGRRFPFTDPPPGSSRYRSRAHVAPDSLAPFIERARRRAFPVRSPAPVSASRFIDHRESPPRRSYFRRNGEVDRCTSLLHAIRRCI